MPLRTYRSHRLARFASGFYNAEGSSRGLLQEMASSGSFPNFKPISVLYTRFCSVSGKEFIHGSENSDISCYSLPSIRMQQLCKRRFFRKLICAHTTNWYVLLQPSVRKLHHYLLPPVCQWAGWYLCIEIYAMPVPLKASPRSRSRLPSQKEIKQAA